MSKYMVEVNILQIPALCTVVEIEADNHGDAQEQGCEQVRQVLHDLGYAFDDSGAEAFSELVKGE